MKSQIFLSFCMIAFLGFGCSKENNSTVDATGEFMQDSEQMDIPADDKSNIDPPWDPYTYVPYPADWSRWEECERPGWCSCRDERDCPLGFYCYCCIEFNSFCSCYPEGTFDDKYYYCCGNPMDDC